MPEEISNVYEFHDECEKKVYIHWINEYLFTNCNIGSHLPIHPKSEELFDYTNDGLIFCYTIQQIYPKSIDMTVLSQHYEMSKEEKLKNIQLAYETARSYGCNLTELRINHIFSGVRQSILEFFWQIFFVGLVQSINYLSNPDILLLKNDGESNNVIKGMKPEPILIRYVNYMIKKYNFSNCQIADFKQDLNDGKIYIYLLDSVAQHNHLSIKHSISSFLKESNLKKRISILLDNFKSLKLHGFLIEDLMEGDCMTQACYKMHILTTAVIFHTFPLLQPELNEMKLLNIDLKLDQESNLEKLCKVFINFLGINPICTNLKLDCTNGLLIADVMDLLVNDIFFRDSFVTKFTDKQMPSEMIHNSAICISQIKKFTNSPINDLYPELVQDGNRKVISDMIYNLILFWVSYDLETDQLFNSKILLSWINSFSNEYRIYSFRDTLINDKRIFAKVIDSLYPKSIDWCYLENLNSNIDRALYCISISRRMGCPMFINPIMMASCDLRCVTLAFAILRWKAPKDTKLCSYD